LKEKQKIICELVATNIRALNKQLPPRLSGTPPEEGTLQEKKFKKRGVI
jgi:hypothetical protein